ncbi:MAG: hypothetical protein ACK4IX_01520 [Candidatus Sericytochromatia bacterium]
MGVPTLTINGKFFASREASNINKYLGLHDFITSNIEEYVNKAIFLSNQTNLLNELRKELRNTFYKSDFTNYNKFTKELERFYKEIVIL